MVKNYIFNENNLKTIESRVNKILNKIYPGAPTSIKKRVISLSNNVYKNSDEITDLTITKICKIVINIYFMTEENLKDENVL